MRNSKVHIVGAGLAGLAAAVALAKHGHRPIVSEAGPHAGGRCRSYFDQVLNCRIDNGNHLLLSGNRHALKYLETIGARGTMTGPGAAIFPYIDLRTGERWTLTPNRGKFPWWLFDRNRRVPGSSAGDYLEPLKLARAGRDATIEQVMDTESVLFRRLWEPLAVSALNTQIDEASASLFWAIIRETLGAGGAACQPLVPREGLSESFVDPAIVYIEAQGGTVHLKRRLHHLVFNGDAVTGLDFGAGIEPVGADNYIVLAVPAPVAADLVPGLVHPKHHRAIVNLHYRIDLPAPAGEDFIGVIGGTAEWIFRKPGVLSVTISAADHYIDTTPETLVRAVWSDIRKIYTVPDALPPWRVVKEKRATFAATPAENARRAPATTQWKNLFLSGDWTDTGLPSTIEGSIRSGYTAAGLILKKT